MVYKVQRNYENLNKRRFEGVGHYNIPGIQPIHELPDVTAWIGFNYARGCEEPELHGIHFFVDDYQFIRVWNQPDQYLNMLKKFKVVCTPDFSTYTDFPLALQIYNHYRKHWLGAYWQENGITVVPTISWSDIGSYSWCFDGEPVGGIVAISAQGTQMGSKSKALFLDGYYEMLRRLKPCKILFYGKVPDGVPADNLIQIQSFRDQRLRPMEAQRSKNNLTEREKVVQREAEEHTAQ
ncbi:MAG: DUF4417 domain-containing protein [Bilifractor sp.]